MTKSAYNRNWYQKNKQHRKEYMRRYRREVKEREAKAAKGRVVAVTTPRGTFRLVVPEQ